jgi:phage tail sheath protein FI
LGEEVTFESSGEPLWGEVRGRLNGFMRGLYDAGAFRGDSPEEAYQVRCDRSTMSQNDIDNGRVVAYVQFDAASIIDTITVVLIVNDGAQVSISGREEAA